MRQGLADTMHILRAAVERVAPSAGIIIGNAATRLHRDGGEAVVVQPEPCDVMRPGGGRRPPTLISPSHPERGVVCGAVLEQWRLRAPPTRRIPPPRPDLVNHPTPL